MPLTDFWQSTVVVLDIPNVATAVVLLGTVCGVQFCAVFQLLLPGFRFQVASPACRYCTTAAKAMTTKSRVKFVYILRLPLDNNHFKCASRNAITSSPTVCSD